MYTWTVFRLPQSAGGQSFPREGDVAVSCTPGELLFERFNTLSNRNWNVQWVRCVQHRLIHSVKYLSVSLTPHISNPSLSSRAFSSV